MTSSIPSSLVTFILLSILSLQINAWETERQAASQLVDLISSPKTFGVTTLSTLYPNDHPIEDLRGQIASGAEYFAPACFEDSADLLMLGMPVSQNWRNILPPSTNSNLTLSINSNPDPSIPDPRHLSKHSHQSRSWDPERPSWRRGMPSKIRTQLMGSVQVLNEAEYQEGLGWMEVLTSQTTQEEEKVTRVVDESSTFQKVFSNLRWLSTFGYSCNPPFQHQEREEEKEVSSEKVSGETNQHTKLSKCYLKAHPDSSHWTPGSDDSDSPHKAMFVRIRIEKIYSVGGFGDEHRIGYVSKEAWEKAWRDRSQLLL